VVDVLRHDHLGEQAGTDPRLRDWFGRQRRGRELRIASRLLATSAGVRRLNDLADEDRRRCVIETFADRLADPDAYPGTARTDLLGLAQVDLFAATRQIRRIVLASVPLPRRPRRFGLGHRGRGGRRDGLVGRIVEEGGAFDPFAGAAEGHLHELGDVVALRVDGAAELTDEGEDFLELGVEVRVVGEQLGDLLAEMNDFLVP
jgi:hypothetical protein